MTQSLYAKNKNKKMITNKQSIIAFSSSTIFLTSIFIATSIRHYRNIDQEYLYYTMPAILGVSIVPSLLVWKAKVTKWYWSIVIGAFVGLILSIIIVQVLIGI